MLHSHKISKFKQVSVQVPEVIKHFSLSTQLNMKFIMLINVKMPTFITMIINTASESLEATSLYFWHFNIYEQF